jgi:hypothetical protein
MSNSTLSVAITSPAPNSVVPGRSFTVQGTVSLQPAKDHILVKPVDVAVRFGNGGPTVMATVHNASWECTGTAPAGAPPNSTIVLTVSASAQLKFFVFGDQAWELEDLDASAQTSAVLPPPVPPTLTITPIASPIVTDDLPVTFKIAGSAAGNDAPIMVVQYAVEGWLEGPYSVINTGGNYASWSITLAAPPGQHLLTVNALDRFGTTASLAVPFTVQPQTPIVIPPGGRSTLTGAPTNASITSWTRLEPQCTDADIGTSSSARVFDPLWMMARQWQMGEFQAEDAGTPAQARVRATHAALTRCFAGELPVPSPSMPPTEIPATAYDPARTPLEVIIERRTTRAANPADTRMLSLAVEAGLHFLRMLDLQLPSKSYRAAFIAKLALQAPAADASGTTDEATERYLRSILGRAPDGRVLAELLRTGGVEPLVLDAALAIAPIDQPKLRLAATAWLGWYDSVCSEPSAAVGDAWNPARLEYAFAVGTRLSADAQDDLTYAASGLDGSTVDWSSFDIHPTAALGTDSATSVATVVEATIPAPVSFRGAPAPRFWEIEDGTVAYGLVPVGPTDLAHLMMIEYASSYGNDWFVVPLTLPVGSVSRVDSLVVTDTFGVRSLVRPIGDPALPPAHFSMWQSSYVEAPPGSAGRIATNRYFLPSTLARTIDGAPLEDVLFMRDEMANLAWAIERSVESPIEQPAQRDEAADAAPSDAAVGAAASGLPRYLLASTVPPNWIPLLPVEQPNPAFPGDPSQVVSRLQKGAVLQPDGSRKIHTSQGDVLRAATPLLLFDEEVPREGARITRQRRLTRWSDGSTWLWTSLRNRVGQGEGSSALQFDQVLEAEGGR